MFINGKAWRGANDYVKIVINTDNILYIVPECNKVCFSMGPEGSICVDDDTVVMLSALAVANRRVTI